MQTGQIRKLKKSENHLWEDKDYTNCDEAYHGEKARKLIAK